MFEVKESIADISTELPCLDDLGSLGHFRFNRYSKVLMIVSYRFLEFLQY